MILAWILATDQVGFLGTCHLWMWLIGYQRCEHNGTISHAIGPILIIYHLIVPEFLCDGNLRVEWLLWSVTDELGLMMVHSMHTDEMGETDTHSW